jgi:hypothetical protein
MENFLIFGAEKLRTDTDRSVLRPAIESSQALRSVGRPAQSIGIQ